MRCNCNFVRTVGIQGDGGKDFKYHHLEYCVKCLKVLTSVEFIPREYNLKFELEVIK
jgi:hypothetical protein